MAIINIALRYHRNTIVSMVFVKLVFPIKKSLQRPTYNKYHPRPINIMVLY